ncbi:hypothetical protein QYS46_00185 [Klebsiella michiganensis]|nr:hypothetical protein [Klebsiella michiganensis]
MALRQDAMTLAREQLAIIEQAMGDTADDELRLTFGTVGRSCQMPSTPSRRACVLPLISATHRTETLARFDAVIASLASEQVTIELLLNKAPVTFDPRINHVLKAVPEMRWILPIWSCYLARFTTPCIWYRTLSDQHAFCPQPSRH